MSARVVVTGAAHGIGSATSARLIFNAVAPGVVLTAGTRRMLGGMASRAIALPPDPELAEGVE